MTAHGFHCPECGALLRQHGAYARGVTRRQRSVLDFIVRFTAEQQVAPTYGEIARALGMKTRARVAQHIKGLVARGLVTSTRQARSLRVTDEGMSLYQPEGAHAA